MVRLIKGKDDVVREVTLVHKKHTIDRSLQLVCPVEIRAVENVDQPQKGRPETKTSCCSDGCSENRKTIARRREMIN